MKNNYISKKLSDIKLSFIILVLYGIMPVIGVAQTLTFSSSNPAITATNIAVASTKQPIYKAVFVGSGNNGAGGNLSKVTFTPRGTFISSDITKYQFWYNTIDDLSTASNSNSNDQTTIPATGNLVTLTQNNIWLSRTYYFWITADISPTAVGNHTLTVDALTTSNFSFGGITKTGTMYIGGTQTIIPPKQFRSITSGNWNANSTWQQSTDGGITWGAAVTSPTAYDYATIQNANTVTLTTPISIANLDINGALDLSTYALTGSGTMTIASTGVLLVGGSSNYPTGFVTTTLNDGSIVNYNSNGAQTVSNQTYSNLVFSGSGAKTLPPQLSTINGDLTLSGTTSTTTVAALTIGANLNIGDGATFNAAGFSLTITGTTNVGSGSSGILKFITSTSGTKTFIGLVTINTGATWDNSLNEDLRFRGGITCYGGGDAGTGTYTFNTNNQTLTGSMSIASISISSGITLTNSGALTVTYALSGSGSFTQDTNSTLNISGTSTITTLDAATNINTVNYNGTANQTIKATNYSNLTLSGTATNTITTSLLVSANFSINTGSIAKLNSGVNVQTNNLTLGTTSFGNGTYGSTSSAATNRNDTYFNSTGIVTVNAACSYSSNASSGIIFTPVIDMNNYPVPVSTTFTSGQYFLLNVIKGLTYKIYTNSSPTSALKMTVYEEGNTTGPVLAYSFSNSGNPGGNVNDVYLSLTSPLSGQVRILVSTQANCNATTVQNLTINSNVSGGQNTQDNALAEGTDTWIGQVYDGIALNNYIGYYNTIAFGSSDMFQETFNTGAFGAGGDCSNTTFDVSSNGSVRAKMRERTFSVRYKMKSSKRGFYTVTLANDDGARLYVDSKLVYDYWTPEHALATNNYVLLSLTGSSSLSMDYYQDPVTVNAVGFYNFTKIMDNTLSTNLNQTVCTGTSGNSISGDLIPTTLPANGISSSGYQWYYSTSTDPTTRIILAGATNPTYTPNSTIAPLNVNGIYYLYRVVTLTSTNNFGATSTYTKTNESNAATIRVRSCPNYWIGSNDPTTGTNWQTVANWSDGIPADGDNIAFAAVGNSGNNNKDALNDLVLDNYYTVGDMTNNSGKRLVIPVATGLTVNGIISSTDIVGDKIYIKSEPDKANGTLIFHNPSTSTVKGTVEMYSKAKMNNSKDPNNIFVWQYFGIPVETIKPDPTLYGAYVRKSIESGTDNDTDDNDHYLWKEMGNNDDLTAFDGYEICQPAATTYAFTGRLVNWDKLSGQLPITTGAAYPGQYLFANPYTAAIDIKKLTFGSDMEASVFLYNTGSYGSWYDNGGVNTNGEKPGQYISIPQNHAGDSGIPAEVPSMSSMLIKNGTASTANSYFNITYNTVVKKNETMQRVKKVDGVTNTDVISTMIDLTGQHYSDRMWIFTEPTCTRNYDNGWDGRKILGSSLAPQIYAIEPDGDYQVNSVSDMHDTDLAFQAGDEVEYTLKFTHENIQRQYAGVYLVDLVENKTIDVTQSGSTYKFATTQSVVPTKRFKILTRHYEKNAPDIESQLKIFSAKSAVYIQNPGTFNGDCTLYNIAGQAVRKLSFGPGSITTVPNLRQGAYVVSATANGEKVSKRVIVQ